MGKIFLIGYLIITVFVNNIFAQKSNIISSSYSNSSDTVRDLIRYKGIHIVEINSKIDLYKFVLNVYQKDTTSFIRITNTSISIYNENSNKLLQIIKDTLDYGFIELGYDDEFPDINFDGYADLPIITGSGVRGISYVDFWLFNPITKIFEYNKNFSNLSNLYIDKSEKSFSHNIYTSEDKTINEKYSIIDNIPTCIFRTVYLTEYDDDMNKYEIVEEFLVSKENTIRVKYCKERIFE